MLTALYTFLLLYLLMLVSCPFHCGYINRSPILNFLHSQNHQLTFLSSTWVYSNCDETTFYYAIGDVVKFYAHTEVLACEKTRLIDMLVPFLFGIAFGFV